MIDCVLKQKNKTLCTIYKKKHTFKKIQGCRKVENKSARKVMSGKYQKKTSIAILISDELYFMVKKNTAREPLHNVKKTS